MAVIESKDRTGRERGRELSEMKGRQGGLEGYLNKR